MQKNETIDSGAADLVARLAMESAKPNVIAVDTAGLGAAYPKSVPVLFDAKNARAASLKPLIEEFRGRPERREGIATVETLESFIALVSRHKDSDSAIFARTLWPSPALTAVIDYHGASEAHEPHFLKHRIVYAFPVTDELKAWIDNNVQPMEQLEFAGFLEEHAAELAAPFDGEKSEYERLFRERFAVPSELLALSRDLEIHSGAKVKRSERLQSGERKVYYAEEHMTGDGQPVDIPGIFVVNVPAFLDGEPVRIPARLRYRLVAGGIKWLYQLYRWEFFLRDRVYHDMHKAAEATALPAYEGAPES